MVNAYERESASGSTAVTANHRDRPAGRTTEASGSEAVMTGGRFTMRTERIVLAAVPSSSITVRRIGYVPLAVYRCSTRGPVAIAPSHRSHAYATIATSSVEFEPSNTKVVSSVPTSPGLTTAM